MKRVLFLLAALAAIGCSQSQSRYAYPYLNVQGPPVDTEIHTYKERIARQDALPGRPKTIGDRNILAGLYLTKAQSTFDPGYFSLAAQTARESLEAAPSGNIPPTLVLASVAEAGHDFEGCLQTAKGIYEQDPSNMDAIGLMASCYLETGRLEEAKPCVDYLVRHAPTLAGAVVEARLLAAQGHDQQAVSLVQQALGREQPQDRKTSARARSFLGEIAMRRGQLALARQLFDFSLQIEPRNPMTLGFASKLAERQHDLEGAAHYAGQGFDNSSNPALLVQLAHIRALQGQPEEARRLWGKAEEMLAPELEKGGYGHARDLARLLIDRGNPEDLTRASRIMQQQVERRHDVVSLSIEAEALWRTGQFQAAADALDQAVKSGIEDPELLQHAADAQEKLGHAEVAARLREQARAIDPQSRPAPWS